MLNQVNIIWPPVAHSSEHIKFITTDGSNMNQFENNLCYFLKIIKIKLAPCTSCVFFQFDDSFYVTNVLDLFCDMFA